MTVNNSGMGDIATSYHSGNLQVLSQRAVDENRKGLQFVLDLMWLCSLGSCFLAAVIHIALEGFISSCGDFPLHTPLKAGAVVEKNGACRTPGIFLCRNE